MGHLQAGRPAEAIPAFEQVVRIARQSGDRQNEAAALGSLAQAHADLIHLHQAIAFYEQALSLAQQLDHRPMQGTIWGNLGITYRQIGRAEEALRCYEWALEIAQTVADPVAQARHLSSRALCHYLLGNRQQAQNDLDGAWVAAQQADDRLLQACIHTHRGAMQLSWRQPQQARNEYEQARIIHQELDATDWLAYDRVGLAWVELEQDHAVEAVEQSRAALALNVALAQHDAALVLGIAGLQTGDDEPAATALRAAVRHARALLHHTPDLYEPRYTLACALYGLKQPQAQKEMEQALRVCALPGVLDDVRRALEHLRRTGIQAEIKEPAGF